MPSYIDSDQVFPKRLGILNSNTIVLQYYNAVKDKFKKHLIPFDSTIDPSKAVQEIYKNSKHVPYLKKVNPKHIKSVLQGQTIGMIPQKEQNSYQEFYQPKPIVQKKEHYHEIENIMEKSNEVREEPQAKIPINLPIRPNVMEVNKNSKKQEPQQYYNEEFQDFQISVSLDKNNHSISSFSKPQSSVQQKSSVSKSSEVSKPQPKKQKKKQKAPVVEIVQQYEDDFQFIDEQNKQKKEKKEKSKSKGKGKSKQKKSKKNKDKQQKKNDKSNNVTDSNDNKTVQQQFQFL